MSSGMALVITAWKVVEILANTARKSASRSRNCW
ncbi:Uncharacterised protein [Mycobacteroides abscessus subsp. abscessus]|nr:Uncharacterised protein [Mycobacteroides abscessus subsp. abscessus]